MWRRRKKTCNCNPFCSNLLRLAAKFGRFWDGRPKSHGIFQWSSSPHWYLSCPGAPSPRPVPAGSVPWHPCPTIRQARPKLGATPIPHTKARRPTRTIPRDFFRLRARNHSQLRCSIEDCVHYIVDPPHPQKMSTSDRPHQQIFLVTPLLVADIRSPTPNKEHRKPFGSV